MTNGVWSGIGVALSLIGFAVGVLEDNQTKTETSARQMPLPKAAVAVLQPTQGQKVEGVLEFKQEQEGVRVRGVVRGLTPGEHGFHIHEFGDLRGNDGTAAGDHYNPDGKKHGSPDGSEHHAGDLGNITADQQGMAKVDKLAKGLKLHFVVGRSIVVHADPDDFESQPSGNAGARVALGVIGYSGPSQANKTTSARE